MKFKFAIPNNLLTSHHIKILENKLAEALPRLISINFPDWQERFRVGNISGGEIILQDTDLTQPIPGLTPGIHLTMSLMSYKPNRDFDGLANDVKKLISEIIDERSLLFMHGINIFIQMTLDRPVAKVKKAYMPSAEGITLLEY